MSELGLIELIDKLRQDIAKLQDRPAMFTIQDIELELKFVVEKTANASGGVHWVLFAADAKGEYKDQRVNTITLRLTPLPDYVKSD